MSTTPDSLVDNLLHQAEIVRAAERLADALGHADTIDALSAPLNYGELEPIADLLLLIGHPERAQRIILGWVNQEADEYIEEFLEHSPGVLEDWGLGFPDGVLEGAVATGPVTREIG